MRARSAARLRLALGLFAGPGLACAGDGYRVDDPAAVLDAGIRALSLPAGSNEHDPGWIVFARGTLNQAAELQGRRPGAVDTARFREALAILPGGRAAHGMELHRVDGTRETVREVYEPGFKTIHVLDGGYSVRLSGGPEVAGRARVRRRMPLALLREARASDAERVEGVDRHRAGPAVVFRPPSGAPLTLVFDPADTTLREVSYPATMPGLGEVTVRWTFGRYRPVPGIGRVPHEYASTIGGTPFTSMTVDSVVLDPAAVAAFAERPPGHERVVEVPPPEGDAAARARVDTVGPGVYVIRNLRTGFHPMFVEFDDFVVAIDAPAGYPLMLELPAGDVAPGPDPGWLSRRYVELIRETVPDKPVAFVVVTHFHNDHGGGVGAFVAEGATVLASEPDEAAIRRYVAASTPRDGSSSPAGRAPVEVVRDRRVITDGHRTLDVLATGPNPHTDDMLVVLLEADGIMFVSDLMNGPPPPEVDPAGDPPLTFFLRWLTETGLAPRTIVTMHGAPVSGAEWQRAAERMGR